MQTLLQDLRLGVGLLKKNSGLTAVAVLMLAIAVGASVVFFGRLKHTTDANSIDLDSLQKRLRAGEIPSLHSFLIIQRNRVIADWYFEGIDEQRGESLGIVKFGPETLHDVRSITKSVVSLLFGIAMADDAIRSLDSPVLDYFLEYRDLQTPERRKIRLRDLLSMTSGLHWDEWTNPYSHIRNSETAMDVAPDRYRYILSQPMDSSPGTKWRYSGGDAALIAAVIARSTNTSIDTYAEKKLFAPLGITKFVWLKDRQGIPNCSVGSSLVAARHGEDWSSDASPGSQPEWPPDRARILDTRINCATCDRRPRRWLHS